MSYRILLIDGDPAGGERLERHLAGAGYDVVRAEPGFEALHAFLDIHPDLALMEAAPDQMKLCEQLKRTETGKVTPIVLFSDADAEGSRRSQVLGACGCDEYVTTPGLEQALLDVLSRLLASPEQSGFQPLDDEELAKLDLALEVLDLDGAGSPGEAVELEDTVEDLEGDDIVTHIDSLLAGGSKATATRAAKAPRTAKAPRAAPTPAVAPASLTTPPEPVSQQSKPALVAPSPRTIAPEAASPKYGIEWATPGTRYGLEPKARVEEEPEARNLATYKWAAAVSALVVLGIGYWALRDGSPSPNARPTAPRSLPATVDAGEKIATSPEPPATPPVTTITIAPKSIPEVAPEADRMAPPTAPPAKIVVKAPPEPARKSPPPRSAEPAGAAPAATLAPRAPEQAPLPAPPTEEGAHAASADSALEPEKSPAPVVAPVEPPPPIVAESSETLPTAPPEDRLGSRPAAPEPPVPSFKPPIATARIEPGTTGRPLRSEDAGTVVLKVLVNERGRVSRVVVQQGIPGSDLEAAAIDAVLRFAYAPGLENGTPVKAWTTETFVFKPHREPGR